MVVVPVPPALARPEPKPLEDGRCVNCGREAYECATCGDLRCFCRTPWAGGHRQHYRPDGSPYTMSRAVSVALAKEAMDERRTT